MHPIANRIFFRFAPRSIFVALLLSATLALGGCGGLSGTYADAESGSSIEFRDGSTCYVTIFGGTAAGEYEIDGDKVIVKVNGQNMVLTRNGDTLEGGPLGMKFVKG